VEAIKKAVEVGLGAAFVSRAAVQKELQLGLLAAVEIEVTLPADANTHELWEFRCSTWLQPCPQDAGHATELWFDHPGSRRLSVPSKKHQFHIWLCKRSVAKERVTLRQGVPLTRQLVCVTDPVRYCSHAVRAFIREMFGLTVETSAIGCFLPSPVRHLLI